MKVVSQIKYDKPRILALDFSNQTIKRIRDAGYDVYRASTGTLEEDNSTFFMPCSISDVEINLISLQSRTFKEIESRQISKDSKENSIDCLQMFIEDVWRRAGVTIFVVDEDVSPTDLRFFGIENMGVLNIKRQYYPAKYLKNFQEEKRKGNFFDTEIAPSFEKYKGVDFHINEGPIAEVYEKYIKNAKHIVFCTDNDAEIKAVGGTFVGYPWRVIFPVRDGTAEKLPLAVELTHSDRSRSIIFLPSFGEKTTEAILELLNGIKTTHSHLFSQPNFEWLGKYRPTPVQLIYNEKDEFVKSAILKIEKFDKDIEEVESAYEWMNDLLIGKDSSDNEPFKEALILALQMLDYTVEDVDKQLTLGQAKKEDLRIFDKEFNILYLGEAKTTDLGAKEQMYQDLNKHMTRYMRETGNTQVRGLLFVNHSIKLEPGKRHPFYPRDHIRAELEELQIIAVDSVYLHSLCQKVLKNELSKSEARKLLQESGSVLTN